MADALAGVLRIGNVVVDVRIRESHNISMQLTRYAVESGRSISDHVVANPNEVEIEFEMTNAAGGRNRAKKAFQDFLTMMQARKPVDIITEHATYRNMVFVSFPAEHAAPNLGTLRGTARFQQAGIVGAETTVTAGREERVLAGASDVTLWSGEKSGNVGRAGLTVNGAERQRADMRTGQDVTYRTGCSFIDSGMQSIHENLPKINKITRKLTLYAGGIF